MQGARQDQMPMHARVATQKLAMRVSQKPSGRRAEERIAVMAQPRDPRVTCVTPNAVLPC